MIWIDNKHILLNGKKYYMKHFSRNEKTPWGTDAWGNPEKMNPYLLYGIDQFRDYIGQPIFIHCGYEESGHTTNSQHYLGNAIDFHVHNMDCGTQFLKAIRFNLFTGIGIYPYWNNEGLHVDVRPLNDGKRAFWWRKEWNEIINGKKVKRYEYRSIEELFKIKL